MDSHIVMSEEQVQAMIHRHRLAEVIATAGRQLAVRSTAVEILIDRVASLWQDPDSSGVISRLAEIELAPDAGSRNSGRSLSGNSGRSQTALRSRSSRALRKTTAPRRGKGDRSHDSA